MAARAIDASIVVQWFANEPGFVEAAGLIEVDTSRKAVSASGGAMVPESARDGRAALSAPPSPYPLPQRGRGSQ